MCFTGQIGVGACRTKRGDLHIQEHLYTLTFLVNVKIFSGTGIGDGILRKVRLLSNTPVGRNGLFCRDVTRRGTSPRAPNHYGNAE